MDASLPARLIVAHLLGDFLLQPDAWVAGRNAHHFRSRYLYLHAAVQFGLALLFSWNLQLWWLALLIALGHLLFDGAKAALRKTGLAAFIADQLLHLLVILAGSEAAAGLVNWSRLEVLIQSRKVWCIAAAYLAATTFYSRLVAFATLPWRADLPAEREPLKAAGRWIGVIERVLVLTFVLVHQFAAIGFLLAAKSVLRFGDLRESRDKGHTEYVLIGTLLSFGLTILTGLLVNYLSGGAF